MQPRRKTDQDQERLETATLGYQEIVKEVRIRSGTIKLERRSQERLRYNLEGKQISSLYDRREKKRAKLTALKDADGHGQRFGHCAGPIGHVLCGDEIFFF